MTLGAMIDVPTLEGTKQLKVPPGSQHGSILRVRDQGLPDIRGGRKGDLMVQLSVAIPKKLSDRQEELLREYAKTEEVDVNSESKSFFDKIKEHFNNK
jgi:molecular chaperone DnaJ